VPRDENPWKVRRRWAAGVLLLGWGLTLWLSSFASWPHVCDDEIARVGTTPLVESCRPLTMTDAPALAVLIIVGVLLLPELSVLEIPGFLRIERELKEQAKRQDDILATIHKLEISQRQQVYNVFDAAKLAELVGLQDEKRQQFESDAT
jgi:hypothetical protein